MLFRSGAKHFLTEFGLNEQNLEPKAKGRGGVLIESQEIVFLNNKASTIAQVMGYDCLDCVHVLITMLSMKNTYAYNKLLFLLGERGSDPNKLLNHIVHNVNGGDRFVAWCRQRDDDTPSSSAPIKQSAEDTPANYDLQSIGDKLLQMASASDSFSREKQEQSTLPFGLDLTEKAAMGGFDPVIGREPEIERVIQTLTRRSKNNPILEIGRASCRERVSINV